MQLNESKAKLDTLKCLLSMNNTKYIDYRWELPMPAQGHNVSLEIKLHP